VVETTDGVLRADGVVETQTAKTANTATHEDSEDTDGQASGGGGGEGATKADALACLDELVADALTLLPECLAYLDMCRDPCVLRFCVLPQVRAPLLRSPPGACACCIPRVWWA
jgi:hypothetical protein